MNATNQEGLNDRLDLFSPAMGVLALQSLDQPDWLDAATRKPVEFAHCLEEEFARLLDEHQIAWRYKHRTFAVEWDEEGNFVDCFTPDFYIPAFDVYVALVATEYRALGAKVRKVRLLREQHPEIRIELLNAASGMSMELTIPERRRTECPGQRQGPFGVFHPALRRIVREFQVVRTGASAEIG